MMTNVKFETIDELDYEISLVEDGPGTQSGGTPLIHITPPCC